MSDNSKLTQHAMIHCVWTMSVKCLQVDVDVDGDAYAHKWTQLESSQLSSSVEYAISKSQVNMETKREQRKGKCNLHLLSM